MKIINRMPEDREVEVGELDLSVINDLSSHAGFLYAHLMSFPIGEERVTMPDELEYMDELLDTNLVEIEGYNLYVGYCNYSGEDIYEAWNK